MLGDISLNDFGRLVLLLQSQLWLPAMSLLAEILVPDPASPCVWTGMVGHASSRVEAKDSTILSSHDV